MNELLTIAACTASGGLAGWAVSALSRPSGRRRGPRHRLGWQRGPRSDPHESTDVPVGGVPLSDADTEQLPLPDDVAEAPGPR